MKYYQFLQYSYDYFEPKHHKRLNVSQSDFEIIKYCFENATFRNSFPPYVASRAWYFYKINIK